MEKRIEIKKYIIFFIMLFVLCWLFPYTGDDWAWGSSIGIERLRTWFDNYSGRYFGNLIVLVLTRSNLLKTGAMAFCLTGIVFCIERLVKQKWVFYLASLLLVLTPKLVFRQAVVWTAGFANYVTSIFFTLIYIVYIYWIFEEKDKENVRKQRPVAAILLFALGAGNTLIVEHLTLYNVVLAVGVLGYVCIKYKKVFIQHVGYFAGTVAGTVMMFSNSVYHSISTNSDGYRSIATGGIIHQALNSYLDTIYEELYMNNIWLNIILAIVCVILYVENSKKVQQGKMKQWMEICLWIICIYAVYSLFSVVGISTAAKQKELMYLEGIATIIGALAVIVYVILLGGIHKEKLHRLLFIMGSVICMTAPLFVVNPIGSRCFFATYVMFIALVCELADMLPEQYVKGVLLRKVCLSISLIGFVFYMGIFLSVYWVDNSRLEYIQTKMKEGAKEIEILHLPYESYIWAPTPAKGTIWEERYKLFNNIPEDVTLKDVWSYSNNSE